MPIINGQYVDDFTYNEMMSEALETGQNFAGNNFVNGTDFDVSSFTGNQTPGLFSQGMDFLNNNMKGIGAATQLGGLALSAYNAFGPGRDMYKKQSQLLDQQIASNRNSLAQKAALDAAWAKNG